MPPASQSEWRSEMSAFMSPRQVAERWGCSARQVRRLCADGYLPAMRLGIDAWRISVTAVEAYESARTPSAVPAPSAPPKEQEVRPATTVDGFTLPADYIPVFPDLWPLHETKKAALQRH